LADNTIVIFNSDQGGVLPRSKRYLFASGLHCPLIVRIPEGLKHLWPADQPGTTIDRLVSFIDMPKTWLSLAGADVPDVMQGQVFLGTETEAEQLYHFTYRARMDERLENARAVSDKRYLYIRNYMPYVPWMQHLDYLWKMKATVAWEAHVKSGKATEVQARFFGPKGWTEELYDLEQDPDNVNNLIDSPELNAVSSRMRVALREWQLEVHDSGMLPESEAMKRAADNNMTLYEMVRDPDLYDLPALLDAADLALEENSANLTALHKQLQHTDSGVRYWAMVGCFLLDDASAAPKGLQDASDEVRAMAAWLAIRSGDSAAGIDCLNQMIEGNSDALLAVLNVIDWAELPAPPESLLTANMKEYPERMQNHLFKKYGIPLPSEASKKTK